MLDMNWVRTQMDNASAKQLSLAAEKASNPASARRSRRFVVGLAIGLAVSLSTGLAILKQLSRPALAQA